MKPEEQRAAIAHACGWREAFPKHGEPHPETRKGGILLPYHWVNEQTHKRELDLPDYLNDLNAMRDAEKMAGLEVIKGMRFHLWLICDQITAHHATAAQRAEAFLKTLNLWKP